MSGRELTGRHVLIITVAAFGTIMAVNFVLAWQAVATFPGLEVKNSYVASQSFDRDRAAQEGLGWDVSARIEDGKLTLTILDAGGVPVRPDALSATLGRATHVADDRTPAFAFDGLAYVAPVDLAYGYWNLRVQARAADGTEFRQRIELFVRPKT
ncbi:MAG: FixH family protein [Pseudomonadota bacterium]